MTSTSSAIARRFQQNRISIVFTTAITQGWIDRVLFHRRLHQMMLGINMLGRHSSADVRTAHGLFSALDRLHCNLLYTSELYHSIVPVDL